MTNQEAIRILNEFKGFCDADKNAGDIEAFDMAIAALEKQEPQESPCKTPVIAKAFDGENRALRYECVSCPNCKKWLSIFGTGKSYCPYCGQAVKSRQYNEER